MICATHTPQRFKTIKELIEFTKEPKYRPGTLHISIKWHHFKKHTKQGKSKIVYIKTNEQQAHILTKPLAKPQLEYLRKQIMG